jgi:hypothetical protein
MEKELKKAQGEESKGSEVPDQTEAKTPKNKKKKNKK